jgi:hypothetical protein
MFGVQKLYWLGHVRCSEVLVNEPCSVFRSSADWAMFCVQKLCWLGHVLCSEALLTEPCSVFRSTAKWTMFCVQNLCHLSHVRCSEALLTGPCSVFRRFAKWTKLCSEALLTEPCSVFADCPMFCVRSSANQSCLYSHIPFHFTQRIILPSRSKLRISALYMASLYKLRWQDANCKY